MELVSSPDRRRHRRSSVILLARCGDSRVRIRNVSADGCGIEGAVECTESAQVVLERGEHRIPGEIVWSHGGNGGLRFAAAVEPAAFARAEAPDWAAQRRYGYVRRDS